MSNSWLVSVACVPKPEKFTTENRLFCLPPTHKERFAAGDLVYFTAGGGLKKCDPFIAIDGVVISVIAPCWPEPWYTWYEYELLRAKVVG